MRSGARPQAVGGLPTSQGSCGERGETYVPPRGGTELHPELRRGTLGVGPSAARAGRRRACVAAQTVPGGRRRVRRPAEARASCCRPRGLVFRRQGTFKRLEDLLLSWFPSTQTGSPASPQGPSGHRPPQGEGGLPSWSCPGGRQGCSAHPVILPANPSWDPAGVGLPKGHRELGSEDRGACLLRPVQAAAATGPARPGGLLRQPGSSPWH